MRRFLAYLLTVMIAVQSLHAIADAHLLHQDQGIVASQIAADVDQQSDYEDAHPAHHHHCCQSHAPTLPQSGWPVVVPTRHQLATDAPAAPIRLIDNLLRPPIA